MGELVMNQALAANTDLALDSHQVGVEGFRPFPYSF